MSTWQIGFSQPIRRAEVVDAAAVPLKWAHDAQTGEARYIHDTEVA